MSTPMIFLIDDDPAVTPMNPAYLCKSGEIQSLFADWEIIYTTERKPTRAPSRRRVAELIARKPRPERGWLW